MITLYGIKNCDTVKKARKWLAENGIEHRFHDFRADGLEAAQIERWCAVVGWEKLLNKAGTTFRQLPPEQKLDLNETRARALMLAQPTLIKRPVLEHAEGVRVGFKPADYAELLG